MNDYTRVNELQDKLLQAMDILNAKALKDISFDRTVLCTIEDDSEKNNGKYIVNDGSRVFTAYSIDTSFYAGNNVYVTIPEGNYENQKMIIGKQTNENEAPFTFIAPFETIFDMTDNVVLGVQNGSLIANALDKYAINDEHYEYITLYDKDCNYYNYSRMGIKANFKTWIKNATKGNYGLAIIFTVQESNTVSEEVIETQYYYKFANDDMYGNVYNFNVEQEQQLVIPLEEIKGTITHIKINFYQEANFYDKFNNPLPCSEKGYQVDENYIFIKDEEGNYLIHEDDIMIEPNIFVNNIYMCFGYDLSIFNKDLVEIYTQNSKSYKHSDSVDDDGIEHNKKVIRTRWIHLKDGKPKAIDTLNMPEKGCEVRWYKYKVGAPAADAYSSVYWERIQGVNGFTYEFNPDVNVQQEKIKIVILQEDIPYYSNELVFENEEDLPPSEEAQKIINALTIVPDDGLNGNYMIYGQDNSIKDTEYSKKIRTISAYFDLNENLEIDKDTEKISDIQNLTWKFPSKNSMIELLNAGGYEIVNLLQYEKGKYYIEANEEDAEDFVICNEDFDSQETYYELLENGYYNKITNFYQPNTYYIYDYVNCAGKAYDNNKVYYILNIIDENNQEYQLEKIDLNTYMNDPENYYILDYYIDNSENKQEKQYFSYNNDNGIISGKIPQYRIASYYSPSKTNNTIICQYMLNGRLYTTEKEFTFGPAGTMGTDQTLVIDFVGDKNSVYVTDQIVKFEVQLYDSQNKLQNIPDGSVTWAWYYNSDKNVKLSTPEIIEKSTNAFLIFEGEDCTFNLDGLYILQATVGSLTTYFPIPISNGQYSYITGPTQVIYQSSGEPIYNREEYLLYDKNEEIVDANWNILIQDYITSYQYLGKITQEKFQEYVITTLLHTKNSSGKYIELTSSSRYNENTVYYLATTNQYIGTINSNNNKLQPLGIYIEGAPVYGVQASINNTTVWTQPILVLQNKWANNVINAWDGKSLVMNESTSTILAAAISAGKKNDDNTFSGVMIGNWKGQDVASDITEQTGVYGFHHGAMSYAWKDDGTGFIGKDGKGRIDFDGNEATIYSANYDNVDTGMKIDLNTPSLYLKYDDGDIYGNIYLDASKPGGITSADVSNAPFRIGDQFAVDWDGTLYAKNGHFEGTISASTLQAYATGRSSAITLDGSIQINHTWEEDGVERNAISYLGQIETGMPDEDGRGLGMKIGNSVIKVTTANAGMSFNTNQYVSVSRTETALGGKKVAIIGKSGNNNNNILIVQNIKAENQYGIYARFA